MIFCASDLRKAAKDGLSVCTPSPIGEIEVPDSCYQPEPVMAIVAICTVNQGMKVPSFFVSPSP